MKSPRSYEKGFGLVEVVIASAVLSVSLIGISGFFQTALRASNITESAVQGDYLLEEGVEAVKFLRDSGYIANIKSMSTTTTYYFAWNGTQWTATTTGSFIDNRFERKLTFSDAYRDVNSDLAASGTYDPNTKRIGVSVAWWTPVVGTTTHSIQAYVTNIFGN